MKKIIWSLSALLFLGACDKNFEEINVNPVLSTTLDPNNLLPNAQLTASFDGNTLIYQSAIVQHTMHPFAGVLAGGNLNQNNIDAAPTLWNQYYNQIILNTVDIIDKTKDDPSHVNLYNITRIWKAYAFQVLTDTYGDIPYAEAGLGFIDNIQFPSYDPQQNIYADLLGELEDAVGKLDPSQPTPGTDLFFQGSVEQWKRFGNSLMLRAAMRLTKADLSAAETYAKKAYAGGTMQSNDDNVVMVHSATYNNPIGSYLNGTEKANFYLNETFVNHLKSTDDPRLRSIAVKYGDATKNPTDEGQTQDHDPANQIGMPIGYDNVTIVTAPNFPGSYTKYSQINRLTLGRIDAPSYHMTYAQTQLLLAEATQRGWIEGTSADVFYEQGIRAHMSQLASYGEDAGVPQEDIDGYIASHPYDPANGLEQINTQYWIASFLNAPEAYANWRRSGYPVLASNDYPSQHVPQGEAIHRLTYPLREQTVNTEKYQEALQRQGPDALNTRVWWDK